MSDWTTLNLRIEQALMDRLVAIKETHGVPVAELTRRALSDLAEKMEKAKTPLPARE